MSIGLLIEVMNLNLKEMVMFKKLVFALVLQGLSLAVYAGSVSCSSGPLEGVFVTGDRSDAALQSNKLFIILTDVTSESCTAGGSQNVKYGYIENTAPAYNSVLSLASMAYATQVDITLVIDDTTAIDGLNAAGEVVSDPAMKAFRIDGLRIN